MDMAQHSRFHLVYDGPALTEHKMNVRALAPALLAMGDLVERANEILNGNQAKVSVNVNASFKSGSFGVDLELAQSLWQKVLDFANSHPVTGILAIVGLLGLGKDTVKGVVQVVMWLRGRGVKRIEPLSNGLVRLYVDNDHMDIEERVLQLLQDYKIRRGLEGVIGEPLQKEGIETVAVVDKDAKKVIVSIDRVQAGYFKAPEPEEEALQEDEYATSLQVLNLAFQDGNKWRFTEGGGNTYYATVSDYEFLKRVQLNQEQFAKDDIIKARVRRIQRLTKDGLKADYEVLEVLEHRGASPKVQLRMDFGPTQQD
ncbi:hypothetical protein [Pseudoxanthomonas sp. UTMC 1351]|uniref:hypothetical protein n=1 Tax=Pseudoxanthomonas sp. UTMC 1351 TaxID=2695853 RepID=UPI0034CD6442